MITHILHPWQDPATVGLIVVPVVPQPAPHGDNGRKLLRVVPTTLPVAIGWDAQYDMDNPRFIGPCPLGVVGDRVGLLEEWAWPGEEFVLYRADEHARDFKRRCDADPMMPQWDWMPAAEMRHEHIRHHRRVVSVGCKLMPEMTPAEAESTGIARDERTAPIPFDVHLNDVYCHEIGHFPDRRRTFALVNLEAEWEDDHPDHPWDTSWAWFVGVEVIG